MAATVLCQGREIPVFLFTGHQSVAQIRQTLRREGSVSEESLSVLDDRVGAASEKRCRRWCSNVPALVYGKDKILSQRNFSNSENL